MWRREFEERAGRGPHSLVSPTHFLLEAYQTASGLGNQASRGPHSLSEIHALLQAFSHLAARQHSVSI